MGNLLNLLPVLLFLVGMLGISAYIQRASKEDRQKNFAKDYFIKQVLRYGLKKK